MLIVKITLLFDINILRHYWVYLKPESTISAINSTDKYGLENLKSIHEAFSVGFTMTQNDNNNISAPDAIAVYR